MPNSLPDATGYSGFSASVHADERVSPVMTHCTKCGRELPESQTTSENPDHGMLLFNQCRGCYAVFIQDFASFRC
jgi:hypothetical protein